MGRFVLHWVCVFALGAVPLVGCTDVVDTVTLSVMTQESPSFEDLFPGPPLEGVEVCETDTANCATTDQNGFAQITLRANQEISFTLEKEGYVSSLVGIVTDETLAEERWNMVRDELVADFSEVNMIPHPWTGGALFLAAFPTMAGVTFDLVDETARVFYRDEAGTANFDLTATTSSGLGAGLGGFVEVPPREYQVEFGGTATNCSLLTGWPGDAANRVRVPIKVGYITYADMLCGSVR